MRLFAPLDVRPRPETYRNLEEGNILFFPRTPFEFPQNERDVLLNVKQVKGAHHKNIAYRPAQEKVTGFDKAADAEALHSALRSYSRRSLQFLRDLLPRYMEGCRVDYASFRPDEEEGRDLPTNKRNDLLHVDAFPSRPTGGDLILRIFTNINPVKSRVWIVSEPFARMAAAHAPAAGLTDIAARKSSPLRWASPLLAAAGLPAAKRSPYDRFMLGFHDYLKRNEAYQRDCLKSRLEFPSNSTWIAFTDIVPHAVLSGRYALEQTVIVPRGNLIEKGNAPIEILQDICGQPLGLINPAI
ncbi:MAG: Kdo hydroxylase family protein [Acidobacteriota bacterium]|nr:Kdo hydroxylase family protein [Acidobacteriota bacterium]